VLRVSLFYGIGGIAAQLFQYLTLPIYTRNLTQAEFGLVALLESILYLSVALITFSIERAAQRFYFDKRLTPKRVFSSALIWLAVSGLVWVLIVFLAEIGSLVSYASIPPGGPLLIVLSAWASGVCGLAIVYFQVSEKPLLFNFLNLVRGSGIFALAYYFIEHNEMGVIGYLLCITAANIMAATFSLRFLTKDWQFSIDPPLIKEMLLFSSPFVPTVLGALLLTMGGRFFLSAFSTLEEVAAYTFLSKVSLAYLMCATAINTALGPVLYKVLAEELDDKKILMSILKPIIRIYGLGAVAFILVARDIGELMGGGAVYELHAVPLSLIIVGHFCSSVMGGSSDMLLSYFKMTKFQMCAFLVGASASVLLSLLLAPELGVTGIVLATTGSLICILFCHCFLINRLPLPSLPVLDIVFWIIGIFLFGLIFTQFKFEFIGLSSRILMSTVLVAISLWTLQAVNTSKVSLTRSSASKIP
jgi:O-antigen/teichoic acid export membrane protein